MKLLKMFIPYITVAVIITVLMYLFFDDARAKAFLVSYTICYAAVMVYLAGNE